MTDNITKEQWIRFTKEEWIEFIIKNFSQVNADNRYSLSLSDLTNLLEKSYEAGKIEILKQETVFLDHLSSGLDKSKTTLSSLSGEQSSHDLNVKEHNYDIQAKRKVYYNDKSEENYNEKNKF